MIIDETIARDPTLLPGYQTEPLFGKHEPRNEIEYDEATGALAGTADLEERPVSPTELFFDLFFAALLSKLGHNLAQHLSNHPLQVLYFILIFQLIYQNWVQVTSYINRFASETASDKLFVAWNLVGLGGVSLNVFQCMSGEAGHDCGALAGWMAFGRSAICVWFLLTMLHTRYRSEKGYEFSRISLWTNLCSVLLMISACIVYQYDGDLTGVILLSISAAGDIISVPILWHTHPGYRHAYIPINANLAAERFGLIYIVSLGELVLSSVTTDFHTSDSTSHIIRGSVIMLLGIFLAFFFLSAFFNIYDLRADKAKRHALEVSVTRAWMILHVTSILALLSSLVAAVFARLTSNDFDATDRFVLWVTLSIKICLFSGSNALYLRHVRTAYGWISDLVTIIALISIGLCIPSNVLDDVTYVGILVGIWCVLMIFRGIILPVRLTDEGVEEVQTLRRRSRFYRLPFVRRVYPHNQQRQRQQKRPTPASTPQSSPKPS